MKHKVNVDNIPDELKPLVHEEMTNQEVALLGSVLVHMKIERFKNKLFGWYYAKKNIKGKNRGSV